MTLFRRRIIYIIFFLVFFVTAPLVLIWAQGYKFNWQQKTWQKTGVLFLESKPDTADIYLNGTLLPEKTTARLKNLTPGEYHIEVKKQDYLPWTKDLHIFPGETAFAQYIRLFKTDPATKILLKAKIKTFSNLKNNRLAFSATSETDNKKEVFLFDAEDGSLKNVKINSTEIDSIILNESGNQALIKNTSNVWYWVDFSNQQTLNISTWASENYKKIIFDPQNPLTLLGLSRFGIDKIIIPNQVILKIISGNNIVDFEIVSTGDVYYLKEKNNAVELNLFSSLNSNQETLISSLPWSDNYQIYPSPTNIINLIDQKNQLLYIFDLQQKIFSTPKTIIPGVNFITWNQDQDSFLFGNAYEIWIWETAKKDDPKQLITRLGSKIKDVLWYPIPTHIIYLTADELVINELVMINYRREITSFTKFKKADRLLINSKGNNLYWFDSTEGLFVSQIQ
ncbi:MAG TPA: PEGA domain-containing protein [bacterium]|nr:PEGA domain-containing protein [bacterium]